jgi:hypothetical protein
MIRGEEIFQVLASLVMGEEVQGQMTTFSNLVDQDRVKEK